MEKKLEKSKVARITYEKDSKGGEPKSRIVMPTYVPGDVVRTIDLTELSTEEQKQAVKLYEEYQQYCDTFLASMHNFEGWLARRKDADFKPKWRAFKLSKLKVM